MKYSLCVCVKVGCLHRRQLEKSPNERSGKVDVRAEFRKKCQVLIKKGTERQKETDFVIGFGAQLDRI